MTAITVDHTASNKTIADAIKRNPDMVKGKKPKVDVPTTPAKSKAPASKAPAKGKTLKSATVPPVKTPAKPDAKTATKPTPATVAFIVKTVKLGTPIHVIAETARPVSGTKLFAHTHAALTVLGMLSNGRPAVPVKAVLSVIGQRAVSYHTKHGNFESAPDHQIRLTISGFNKFVNRAREGLIDNAIANAFMDIFVTGKADSKTGVSQSLVFPVLLSA